MYLPRILSHSFSFDSKREAGFSIEFLGKAHAFYRELDNQLDDRLLDRLDNQTIRNSLKVRQFESSKFELVLVFFEQKKSNQASFFGSGSFTSNLLDNGNWKQTSVFLFSSDRQKFWRANDPPWLFILERQVRHEPVDFFGLLSFLTRKPLRSLPSP